MIKNMIPEILHQKAARNQNFGHCRELPATPNHRVRLACGSPLMAQQVAMDILESTASVIVSTGPLSGSLDDPSSTCCLAPGGVVSEVSMQNSSCSLAQVASD